MVQGKTKGLQAKATSTRHTTKAAANTKKGKRHVPPKQTALVKQASLHKVRSVFVVCCSMLMIPHSKSLSAKINLSIEKQMVNAASAGKLTIMKNIATDAECGLSSCSCRPHSFLRGYRSSSSKKVAGNKAKS
jgi:hypothetical protein